MTTARRPGGPGRHRDFLLLWTGETVSAGGTAMAATGVPLLAVTMLHAGTFAVAWLGLLDTGLLVAVTLPAGALGTALGPRGALWVLQAMFAPAGLIVACSRIRASRQLPARPASFRPGDGVSAPGCLPARRAAAGGARRRRPGQG